MDVAGRASLLSAWSARICSPYGQELGRFGRCGTPARTSAVISARRGQQRGQRRGRLVPARRGRARADGQTPAASPVRDPPGIGPSRLRGWSPDPAGRDGPCGRRRGLRRGSARCPV